eukprot:1159792-Pelagomonas_calceolata.AAC.1
MLFPLSVIKTRQMASHGVSGGFQARHFLCTSAVIGSMTGLEPQGVLLARQCRALAASSLPLKRA